MFTDKEYRILLSAMSREMEVCKVIDSEGIREPYEISLVSIRNSINQKLHNIQHKYKWHDLRKYPDDLPKINEFVECECSNHERNILRRDLRGDWFPVVEEADYPPNFVIAWRKIEPFEEEDEE